MQKRSSTARSSKSGLWLYGMHTVQAALENPNRQKSRLIATDCAFEELSHRLTKPLPFRHEIMDRLALDKICGRDAVHQGVALSVSPLPDADSEAMLQRPGPILILDQVTDPRNIGAILRSAMAFGAAGVIMQDRHSPEESGVLAKAASGALDHVLVMRAVNLNREIDRFKEKGFWVVGLDAHGELFDGNQFSKRRLVLVLGAEGSGIRPLIRKNCDEFARLNMRGPIDSLNVSVAAAVALYEVARTSS